MSILDNVISTYGSGSASIRRKKVDPFTTLDPTGGDTPSFLPNDSLASSRQAGFPERVDVSPDQFKIGDADVTGAVTFGAQAAQTPAYLRERPFAALDVAISKVTGQQQGPLEGIVKGLEGIPVIGPVLSGQAWGAYINAADVRVAADAYKQGLSDSTPLSDIGRLNIKGVSGGNVQQGTLRDLKQSLYDRGLTPEDIAAVAAGTKTAYDFGDHPISKDPWVNLGAAILDPTFFLPGIAESRAPALAAKLGMTVGRVAGAARGTEIFKAAVATGLPERVLDVKQAAQAWAAGTAATAATLPGLAQFFKVVARSGKSLEALGVTPAATARAYFGIKGQLALTAAPAAIDFLSDHTDRSAPQNGWLENLRSFADQIENDKPLSSNAMFGVYAAMHFPLRQYLANTKRAGVIAKDLVFGSGELERFSQALGVKSRDLLRFAGDKNALGGLVDFIDEKIALGRLNSHPLSVSYLTSLPEQVVRFAMTREMTAAIVGDMRAKGQITMADRAQAFKEWYTALGDANFRGVRQQWDPKLAVEQWTKSYLPLAQHNQPLMAQVGVALGLNDSTSVINSTIAKEHIDVARNILRQKAVDGMVHPRDIQAVLDRIPLDKIGTKPEYWDPIRIRDAKPVPLRSLEGKLGALKKDAPELRDILAPFAERERRVEPMGTGTPDLANLNNVLEGGTIGVSRMTPQVAAEVGLPGEAASTLAEAQAARAHPAVQHAERAVPLALAHAGFPIQLARRAMGGWQEGFEPSIAALMAPGPISDLRLAGALAGHVMDQNAVLLKVESAANLRAAGVSANAHIIRFDGLPSQFGDQIYAIAGRYFPDGFTYDQVAGRLEAIITDEARAADALGVNRRVNAATRELRNAIPQDAAGGARVAERSTRRVYAEFLDRSQYGSVIGDAAAAGDARVYAFDALSADIAGASERAAALGLPAGGRLGGGLGLGGSRLPRTPRDWGDVVPGESPTPGGPTTATEQLRTVADSAGFHGDESYITFARELDQNASLEFPLPKERVKPVEGQPEFFDLTPEQYNAPLTEPPARVAPAAELAQRLATDEAPGPNAARFREVMGQAFKNLAPEQVDAVGAVAEARAAAWSRATGKPADQWYASRLASIGQDLPSGPLFQAIADHGLDAEAPQVLKDAGLGASSPVQPFDIGNGKKVYVPGGMDGTFSYWDMWRLHAQGINPAELPTSIRRPLYEKIFRTMGRDLETDPLDGANRTLFALLSPGTNLTDNAALYGRIRVTNMEDAQRLADIAKEVRAKGVDPKRLPSEIGFRIQQEIGLADMKPAAKGEPRNIRSAVSRSTNVQLGNAALFMERFVENPEWFLKKPTESLVEYTERLINSTPGAGFKVGNFGVMLGNPLTHPVGTVDSHVMEILGLGNKSPKAKEIPYYLPDGQINPNVPPHLRDLPWPPEWVPNRPLSEQPKVLVYGGNYAEADALLRKAWERDPGNTNVGGHQWFVWDPERAKLEPHQYAFPGAYKLPRQPLEEANRAYGILSEAGFTGRGSPTPFQPGEGLLYQGEAAAKGATGFLDDGRAVIGAFEKHDVSTAVHELGHVFRRDLLDSQPILHSRLENALGVKNGEWTTAHEEAFARGFERYLRDGRAPTAALTQVFARFRDWLSQIYRRLVGGPLAERVSPELRQVFDEMLTPSEKRGYLDPSHQAIMDLAAKGEEVGVRPGVEAPIDRVPPEYLVKRDPTTNEWVPLVDHATALADARAAGRAPIAGLHPKLRDFDPQTLQAVNELEAFVRENYPRYRLEPAPQIATTVKPKTAQQVALKEYNALGQWLFNGGRGNIFSPVFNFMRWAMTPVQNSVLRDAATQAFYSEIIRRGGTAKQVDAFLALAREASDRDTFAGRRVKLFRDWTSLPVNTLNDLAVKAGMPPSVVDALGPGRFHLLVDRASSRYYRNLQETVLKGGKRGSLARSLEVLYEGFQNAPGIHFLYDTERVTAKTFYHIFRFILDPRWWTYNLLEADAINAFRHGIGATGFAGEVTRTGDRAAFVHGQGRLPTTSELKGTAKAKGRVAPPPGQRFLYHDEGPGHYSGWNDTRNLSAYVIKAFDKERPASTRAALDALGENHPVITALRDRFGESVDDWVKGLDETLYNFDTLGVKGTVDEAARQLEAQGLLSVKDMKPFIEQIYNRNQQLYDDIVRNLHGNGQRTNLERMLNSYWLYWPISYQLKAGKWLFDVLTHKAFGHETNLLGLYAYEKIREKHMELMATDADYGAIFNDHPELWFAAQMLLPITPEDLGVSLSRPVRYAGSFAKDVTGGENGPLAFLHTYKAAEDPVKAAMQVVNIGPFYTAELLQNIWDELKSN